MILAILLALAWNPAPPSVDTIVETAFTRERVMLPCPDPDDGLCLVSYLETWREVLNLPGTATRADWTAPDLPSGGVAYMTVSNCRLGCCNP